MKCAEVIESVPRVTEREKKVRLPLGLLGFEQVKEYVLMADASSEPFLWLQVSNDPNLAFLVLSPFTVVPTYQPDIPEEDIKFLGLKEPEDAVVLNIVTLRGEEAATLNLKGPIVVNRKTLVGKQIIPLNAAEYSVQYPLPVSGN